jgi:6,7-dimethyl-8-ribityllumazine synthase
MGLPDYRPFDLKTYPLKDISELCIGVIRTEWNDKVVSSMHKSCLTELKKQGLDPNHLHSYTVPGSYELPMGVKMMLGSVHKPDAVICLGCVIQGETKHDDYINHAIAQSLNQIGLVSGTPVIFGVLTTNSMDQALARAGGDRGDKGSEAAMAALKMISLKEQLAGKHAKIGF